MKGHKSGNSLFGGFYPLCPCCEPAPVIDGYCHHADAQKLAEDPYWNTSHGYAYCGMVCFNHKCPLG